MMVRLAGEELVRADQLLEQHHPRELVRERHRAERQLTRAQRLDHELFLPLPQPGSGQWDLGQEPGVGAFSACSGR